MGSKVWAWCWVIVILVSVASGQNPPAATIGPHGLSSPGNNPAGPQAPAKPTLPTIGGSKEKPGESPVSSSSGGKKPQPPADSKHPASLSSSPKPPPAAAAAADHHHQSASSPSPPLAGINNKSTNTKQPKQDGHGVFMPPQMMGKMHALNGSSDNNKNDNKKSPQCWLCSDYSLSFMEDAGVMQLNNNTAVADGNSNKRSKHLHQCEDYDPGKPDAVYGGLVHQFPGFKCFVFHENNRSGKVVMRGMLPLEDLKLFDLEVNGCKDDVASGELMENVKFYACSCDTDKCNANSAESIFHSAFTLIFFTAFGSLLLNF